MRAFVNVCVISSGKNKKTPSKMGGDRFIPTRNNKQMDVANFLLTKENEPADANPASSIVSSLTDVLLKLDVEFRI